jgi:hypothetical protein
MIEAGAGEVGTFEHAAESSTADAERVTVRTICIRPPSSDECVLRGLDTPRHDPAVVWRRECLRINSDRSDALAA